MSVKHRIQQLEGRSDLGINVSDRRLIEKQAKEIGVAPNVVIALAKAIRAGRLPAESETA